MSVNHYQTLARDLLNARNITGTQRDFFIRAISILPQGYRLVYDGEAYAVGDVPLSYPPVRLWLYDSALSSGCGSAKWDYHRPFIRKIETEAEKPAVPSAVPAKIGDVYTMSNGERGYVGYAYVRSGTIQAGDHFEGPFATEVREVAAYWVGKFTNCIHNRIFRPLSNILSEHEEMRKKLAVIQRTLAAR